MLFPFLSFDGNRRAIATRFQEIFPERESWAPAGN